MTLCLVLEGDADPSHGPRVHAQMVELPSFWPLSPPASRGELTVISVPLDGDPRDAQKAVYAWATSAWCAWQEHHDTVRGWITESGLARKQSG